MRKPRPESATKEQLEAMMAAPLKGTHTLRLPHRSSAKKAGYAASPGTGPNGETCGSCKNICANRMAKTYYKCGLMRAHWTGGNKTDVLVRSPACSLWEKQDGAADK